MNEVLNNFEKELRAYCKIWNVPFETTRSNPSAALDALKAMYAIPMFTTEEERRVHILKILKGVGLAFPDEKFGGFTGQIAKIAGPMQAWPQRYEFLTSINSLSNEELIQAYHAMKKATTAVGAAALFGGGRVAKGAANWQGSVRKAAREGLAEGILKRSMKDGIKKGYETITKEDSLRQAAKSVLPQAGPMAGAKNVYTGLFTAVMTMAWAEGKEKLAVMEYEAERRYGDGEMPKEQYDFMTGHSPFDEYPDTWYEELP